MARQRDYAAEYQARRERAIERGFSSYREERQYRVETKEQRERFKEVYERETGRRMETANPQEVMGLRDYQRNLMAPNEFVARMIRAGSSREEALEAMRAIYGDLS